MLKIARAFIKLVLVVLAIPAGVCMLGVLLFVWAPFILLASLIANAQAFATNSGAYINPLNDIRWFFWEFVMFNHEKANEYLF